MTRLFVIGVTGGVGFRVANRLTDHSDTVRACTAGLTKHTHCKPTEIRPSSGT